VAQVDRSAAADAEPRQLDAAARIDATPSLPVTETAAEAAAEVAEETAETARVARLQVVRGREEEPAAPALGEEVPQGDSELRDFTRKIGAASLPDLLEASAAFATIMRGQVRFSRRDIMVALDEIGPNKDYTQEARIKSFGKLLRKGSIVRVDDGKFALSRAARFSYETKLGRTGTD
jgi:hypothetical protein